MEPHVITRGAKTSSDLLAVLLGNRRYGLSDLTSDAIFAEPIPEGLLPLAAELQAELQLPQLSAAAPRAAIYEAYRHDVGKFDFWFKGFETFAKAAIQASVKASNLPKKKAEAEWAFVQQRMPFATKLSFIDFTAEVAAKPEADLLVYLKQEADLAVGRLLRCVCTWFDLLVSREFIGLVHVMSAGAARYYYFHPLRTEKVIEEKSGEVVQIGFDATRPFGQRRELRTETGKLVEVTHDLERHDHDIIGMQTNTTWDYPDPLPVHVIDLLRQTPAFIRKHLRVVSGTIVKETIHRRTTETEMQDTRSSSTWLASPALDLGGYAVAGWSERDMKPGYIGFSSFQKAGQMFRARLWNVAEKCRRMLSKHLIAFGVLVIAVFALIALAYWSGAAPTVCGTVAIFIAALVALGSISEE